MSVRLYAVVLLRRRLPAGLAGVQQEVLRLLKFGDAKLVISQFEAPVESTTANLVEFHRAIERLAAACDAILPARFNLIADSAATLKRQLAEQQPSLRAALALVRGRVQMTMRTSETDTDRKAERVPRSSSDRPGTAYLNERVLTALPQDLALSRSSVRDLVRAERIENAGELGTAVYHLIDRNDVLKYRESAGQVQVSGPFAPYAFASGIIRAAPQLHEGQNYSSSRSGAARSRARRRGSRNPDGRAAARARSGPAGKRTDGPLHGNEARHQGLMCPQSGRFG